MLELTTSCYNIPLRIDPTTYMNPHAPSKSATGPYIDTNNCLCSPVEQRCKKDQCYRLIRGRIYNSIAGYYHYCTTEISQPYNSWTFSLGIDLILDSFQCHNIDHIMFIMFKFHQREAIDNCSMKVHSTI